MVASCGHNLALAFIEAQQKAFDYCETNIRQRISELSLLNDQNRELQKLISALTTGKKDKKVDFTNDEEMKGIIDRIFERSPEIFGHELTYKLDSQEDIETALQLLDNAVKTQVTKVNEVTMYINQGYEDRIQYTESARKTLEMLSRHCESIIAKYTK